MKVWHGSWLKIEEIDLDLSDAEATDMLYNSDTYAGLADVSTRNYQKPWRDIYEMLLAELDI